MIINISHLPENPWVYLFKSSWWKILYVWKAKNIKKRVKQYFNTDIWIWKQEMVSKSANVDFMIAQTEQEAFILESNLIKEYQPRYNTLLKWDNSYTYIKITNHDFPQIVLTRFKDNDWAIYIWPKAYRQDLKKMLQLLRQFFLYRNCTNTQFSKWILCQDYIFWLCSWWCSKQIKISWTWVLWIEKEDLKLSSDFKLDRNKVIAKYKDNINIIIDFFNWKTQSVQDRILEEINISISKENFERASFLKNIYLKIQSYTEKQSVELSNPFDWYFYKIWIVWDWYVFVVLKFHRWKLIDIIKWKEYFEDTSFNLLKITLEEEFGKMKILKSTKIFSIWASYNIDKNYDISDILIILDNIIESVIISTSMENDNLLDQILKILQNRYNLKNYPYRIECIDISHLSWSYTSWWLSCMTWWLLNKKWYRMYKINSESTNASDDYAAIKEVLYRRFSNSSTWLPDLFVIDWWKWQLWVLKKLIEKEKWFEDLFKKVDFISIWKWSARKVSWKLAWNKEKIFYIDNNWIIKNIDISYDNADKLLIKLRDEAHRFSNSYRKKQMSKEFKI